MRSRPTPVPKRHRFVVCMLFTCEGPIVRADNASWVKKLGQLGESVGTRRHATPR